MSKPRYRAALLALLLLAAVNAEAKDRGFIVQANSPEWYSIKRVARDSWFFTTMVIWGLDIRSVRAPAPPPRYDHYDGPYEIRHDVAADDARWAWTEPPKYQSGPCIIHLLPFYTFSDHVDKHGYAMVDDVGFPSLIRHELGHCAGGVHPGAEHKDAGKWLPNPNMKWLGSAAQPETEEIATLKTPEWGVMHSVAIRGDFKGGECIRLYLSKEGNVYKTLQFCPCEDQTERQSKDTFPVMCPVEGSERRESR